jgi:hypothetical protein
MNSEGVPCWECRSSIFCTGTYLFWIVMPLSPRAPLLPLSNSACFPLDFQFLLWSWQRRFPHTIITQRVLPWKGTVDSQQQSGSRNSCFKDTGKLAEIVLMFLYSYSRMQRDGQSQFPSFTAVKGNQQFEDWRWWQPFVSVLVLQACDG